MIMTILAAALSSSAISAPGPSGDLQGTYVDAGQNAPVVLILPGSGPTDRDGNNPMGVKAAPYRLLAEALAGKGISSVRIDKRGLFGSKAAVADPNDVTLTAYAQDTAAWVKVVKERTGAPCVWLAGHSEGGLVAMTAGQQASAICGVIAIASPGRRMADLLRDQLRSNPANAPLLDSAFAAIAQLESGKRADVEGLHPALLPLFAPQVQPFLIDLMAADPARLAATLDVPLLIISGGEDLQVVPADAEILHKAQPRSRLLTIDGMNHVLKQVPGKDRAANFASYADPDLPIDTGLVSAISEFVRR